MKICHSKGGKGGGMKKARVARVVPKAAYGSDIKPLNISNAKQFIKNVAYLY